MNNRRNYKFLLCGLSLGVLCAFVPSAYPKNSLNCTIVDETGKPLAKQEIVLTTAGTQKEQKKKTNDKGEVEFKGLDDGSYQISAEAPYLPAKSEAIELSGNAEKTCKQVIPSVTYANSELQSVMQLVQQKKYAEAEEKSKKLVAMMPNEGASHYVLAVTYAYEGNEAAVAEVKKAAELTPDKFQKNVGPIQLQAFNTEADALRQKGDIPGAIKKYEAMLAISPNDPTVYFNLAITYAAGKNYDLALKNIDLFLAIKPDDQEAKTRKAQWEKQFQDQLNNPLK